MDGDGFFLPSDDKPRANPAKRAKSHGHNGESRQLMNKFLSAYDHSGDMSFRDVMLSSGASTSSPFGFTRNKQGTLTFLNSVCLEKQGEWEQQLYSPFLFEHSMYHPDTETLDMDSDTFGFTMRITRIHAQPEQLKDGKGILPKALLCKAGGVITTQAGLSLPYAFSCQLLSTRKDSMLSMLYAKAYHCKPNLHDDRLLSDMCMANGIPFAQGKRDMDKFCKRNEVEFLNRYSIRMYDPATNRIATFFNWSALF